MSSSANFISLAYATQKIFLYGGLTVLVTGMIGGILNTIVFLSLQTFRQNSCAFYLTIMSIVNMGQLLTGLLSRITISGFSVDWTQRSVYYCKARYFIFQLCTLISFTCMCLATIDQYFATCFRPRWQRWSNIKLSYRIIMIFSILWLLHGIPFLIFYDHVLINNASVVSCTSTSAVFLQYYIYGFFLILAGLLPVFITVVFGCLAYRNVRNITYRTVPLIRRELDKQLTVMVLVQVVVNFFTIVPFVILNTLANTASIMRDPATANAIQFAISITGCLYYSFFASSFYIYIFVSERFRQQFIHVFWQNSLFQWRRREVAMNQIMPNHNIELK